MGARMSRLSRFLRRPLETQGKIDRILEGKPISAPKHPSSKEAIERMSKESLEEFKARDRKDEKFLSVMKNLKVDSTDVKMENSTSSRPLPQSRSVQGNLATNEVPKGKLSSQKLIELFNNHLQGPEEWTEQKISQYYELSENDVKCLLKYFGGYAVVQRRELPKPLEKVTFID